MIDNHVHISWSGASTSGAFEIGQAEALESLGYTYKSISGISWGAIMSLFVATKRLPEIREVFFDADLCTIFNVPPVRSNGNLTGRAKYRLLMSETCDKYHSLGESENLEEMFRKIFTEDDFQKYLDDKTMPPIYIGVWSKRFKRGIKYFNLKECKSYDEAVSIIMASAAIPLMVETVRVNGVPCFDGGVIDHSPSVFTARNLIKKGETLVSCYSRPKDYDVSDPNWEPTNISSLANDLIQAMNANTSLNDEEITSLLAYKKKFKEEIYYAPHILKDHVYEINEELSREIYRLGIKSVLG